MPTFKLLNMFHERFFPSFLTRNENRLKFENLDIIISYIFYQRYLRIQTQSQKKMWYESLIFFKLMFKTKYLKYLLSKLLC